LAHFFHFYRIKVWRLDENSGTWSVEDDWKAHDAPVSKLSWAHPEFGTIIASSSFDRTVKIWEQSIQTAAEQQQSNASGPGPSTSRWVERVALPDARGTVRAVEFAPHQFGLKLVCWGSRLFKDPQNKHSCFRPLLQQTTFSGYTNA
jgi:nucleoporin SEH1